MKKIDRVLTMAMLVIIVCVSLASAEQATNQDKGAESPDKSAAPGYVFDVMNPPNGKPAAAAEEATGADKGAAKTQEVDVSVPPEYYVDVLKAQDPKRAADDVSVSPRHFFDIFYGSVTTADTTVSAFSQEDCLFSAAIPRIQPAGMSILGLLPHLGSASAGGSRVTRV